MKHSLSQNFNRLDKKNEIYVGGKQGFRYLSSLLPSPKIRKTVKFNFTSLISLNRYRDELQLRLARHPVWLDLDHPLQPI